MDRSLQQTINAIGRPGQAPTKKAPKNVTAAPPNTSVVREVKIDESSANIRTTLGAIELSLNEMKNSNVPADKLLDLKNNVMQFLHFLCEHSAFVHCKDLILETMSKIVERQKDGEDIHIVLHMCDIMVLVNDVVLNMTKLDDVCGKLKKELQDLQVKFSLLARDHDKLIFEHSHLALNHDELRDELRQVAADHANTKSELKHAVSELKLMKDCALLRQIAINIEYEKKMCAYNLSTREVQRKYFGTYSGKLSPASINSTPLKNFLSDLNEEKLLIYNNYFINVHGSSALNSEQVNECDLTEQALQRLKGCNLSFAHPTTMNGRPATYEDCVNLVQCSDLSQDLKLCVFKQLRELKKIREQSQEDFLLV